MSELLVCTIFKKIFIWETESIKMLQADSLHNLQLQTVLGRNEGQLHLGLFHRVRSVLCEGERRNESIIATFVGDWSLILAVPRVADTVWSDCVHLFAAPWLS